MSFNSFFLSHYYCFCIFHFMNIGRSHKKRSYYLDFILKIQFSLTFSKKIVDVISNDSPCRELYTRFTMILFLPFSEKNYFQNIPPFYPIINLFKGSKPRAQLSSLLFNYSTQGRGSKSRNRNNKVLNVEH